MPIITTSQLRRLAATILFGCLLLLPAVLGSAPAPTGDAAPPATGPAMARSAAL